MLKKNHIQVNTSALSDHQQMLVFEFNCFSLSTVLSHFRHPYASAFTRCFDDRKRGLLHQRMMNRLSSYLCLYDACFGLSYFIHLCTMLGNACRNCFISCVSLLFGGLLFIPNSQKCIGVMQTVERLVCHSEKLSEYKY